eukprot:TRINITY_DN33232_c0_g1_i1.p2 TRINITY_DN33232_c0_g1~~TRINITY_DN33232_c0_g1_i1.p2  ORF type:complete len:213 (+),score=47.01 TRINITY_DN33232_c0_g1_i1:58-639(+)
MEGGRYVAPGKRAPSTRSTPLATEWVWYVHSGGTPDSHTPWCSIKTTEEFWATYSHIRRPGDLLSGRGPSGCEVSLFRDRAVPRWEDPANVGGGRVAIRFRDSRGKGSGINGVWEAVLLHMIGMQFSASDKIVGALVKVQPDCDVIQLWTRELRLAEQEALLHELGALVSPLHRDGGVEKYREHPRQEPLAWT